MGDAAEIRQEDVDGVGVITVGGEVDVASGTALSAAIARQAGPVVLDVRGCTFMDSSGLKALLVARGSTADRGDRLVLVAAPENAVVGLLEITGTARLFNVRRELNPALELARQPDRRQVPDRRRPPGA